MLCVEVALCIDFFLILHLYIGHYCLFMNRILSIEKISISKDCHKLQNTNSTLQKNDKKRLTLCTSKR